VDNKNNCKDFSPHSSVSPIHLLEFLIVIIICCFLIEWTFAIWRRPLKRKKGKYYFLSFHLLEFLIVIIIRCFFIGWMFAIWRRYFKRSRRKYYFLVLSQEKLP